MCGILAILRFDGRPFDASLVERMRDTMLHRGPDDCGIVLSPPAALAHRRLSIIDLTGAGRQPMTNEDGSLVLVFNGEIYNYLELAADLKKRGHRFHSTSDTEVILHQYEEDGEACLEKLNGMFSFVLWDSRRRRLFAARDRMGIKPLHYYQDGQQIILASEIKALLEDPSVPREPDLQALADFFFAGYTLGAKTLFRGVRQVEPGRYLIADASGHVGIRQYWDLAYRYDYARSDQDVQDELAALLDDAVRVHCRSDASLGCHLSGGLDSSTVTALAARHRTGLKTFSIKFSDDAFVDETHYAKAVAKHVGAEYCEQVPSDRDMASLLAPLLWHMDTPMTTAGAFAYYTVSRLARQHVKVSLTGHGGDELFAGYPAQFQASFGRTDMFELLVDPHRTARRSLLKKVVSSMASRGLRGTLRSVKNRMAPRAKGLEERWLDLHCTAPPCENGVYEPDFVRALDGYDPREEFIAPLRSVPGACDLDRCLYHDLRMYLPSLLHFEDRVSMALSLESRVPFLDHRVVEFLATVPLQQKVTGLAPKHLLRRISSRLLPEEVWTRRQKFNFAVPGKMLLSPEMQTLAEEVLLSPASLRRGIVRASFLKSVRRDTLLLWMLMNMELWFRIFIDRDLSPYAGLPARNGQ